MRCVCAAQVEEYISQHEGTLAPTDGPKKGKGPRKRRRSGEVNPAPPKGGPRKKAQVETPTKPTKGPFTYEEGATGPNGLPRMKGGNPKGSACKAVAAGKECPFEFCSFSHAKK